MQFPSLTARLAACAVAWACLVSAPPSLAAAADADAPPAAASAATPAPPSDTWIAPEDVADRADSLSRQLEAMQADKTTEETVSRIAKGVADAGAALDTAYESAKGVIRERASLMAIQDARQQVQAAGRDLPAWEEELTEQGRRLADLGARLETARQLWTRTRARPEIQAEGEVLLRRIDRSLQDIEQAAKDVRDERLRVLALDDRIVDRNAGIRDTLHNLEEATRARGSNLAVPDRDPIWRRGLEKPLATEWSQVPARIEEFQRSTNAYFETDSRPFLLQAALALLMMALFHRIRGYLGHSSITEHMSARTVRLLSLPYAMALLLALLPSPLLHPNAPRRATQLLGMLALFPVARILSLATERAALSLYAGLLLLLVFDRIGIALTGLPTVSLIQFLVEIVTGWSLAFVYRRRLRAENGSRWLIAALTAGMSGLLLALLAEFGGWSSLASMVGRLILVGALTGILIGAATMSIEALVAFALASPLLRESRFVNANQELVHRWSSILVRLAGATYWLRIVMNSLGLRAVAGETASAVLDAGITVGALSISIGGTLAFVLTLFASLVISRIVHEVLEDELFPRMNLPRGIPHALTALANYTVWSLGFLLALAAAGVQLSQLAIMLGGLGVGIGLGLQGVVTNFAAGITLLLERRVHVGDTVEIADKKVFGRVLSIGMRASVVRNWNGTEVVMPNENLVDGTVTNWTLSDPTHRIEVPVAVADDADPEVVMKLLVSVAREDDGLLRDPGPSALFLGFSPGTLNFRLGAWTSEDYEKTGAHTSRLTLAVFRALKEAGIALPSADREVTLVPVAPAAAAAPAAPRGKP